MKTIRKWTKELKLEKGQAKASSSLIRVGGITWDVQQNASS
jgi:hypothetical protein